MFEDGVFGNDPLASTTVKKSGTNDFDGSAADYGRTRVMTHRQFFHFYRSSQAQPGNPNGVPGFFMQPDASASGPVVLPKVYNGRNKTYEDYSGRVDQQFSSNVKMYGSYTYNHQNGLQRPTSMQVAAFDGTTGINSPFTQQNVSGRPGIFGPAAANDLRLGFFRARNDTFVASYGQNWASTLGIPNVSGTLMPSFSASALGAGTYTTAPGYAQLYGLAEDQQRDRGEAAQVLIRASIRGPGAAPAESGPGGGRSARAG